MSLTFRLPLFLALLAGSVPAAAQDSKVPYWASIHVSVANMRVGPARTYNIEWVYKRDGLPVRVLRRKEGWRLVEDPDGARGWMLGRFLSRQRTAIVIGETNIELREKGEPASGVLWHVQPGVAGNLGDCEAGWCALDVDGRRGFVRAEQLWGPGAP
ncbi:MAG: hypothetical protein KUG65_06265 [Sphingomonadaceae bacterium]|nr:hypothetical protein [Sphingomonadaceae bacterium]